MVAAVARAVGPRRLARIDLRAVVWPAASGRCGTRLQRLRRLLVAGGASGAFPGPRRRQRPNQSAASSAWTPSWVTIDVTLVVLAELPATNRREGLCPCSGAPVLV